MTEEWTEEDWKSGVELLMAWSKNIAMLPLEKMLEKLNHAETVGPFLDPTLYQKYLHSDNGRVIKDLIEAGIDVKRVVMANQPERKKT